MDAIRIGDLLVMNGMITVEALGALAGAVPEGGKLGSILVELVTSRPRASWSFWASSIMFPAPTFSRPPLVETIPPSYRRDHRKYRVLPLKVEGRTIPVLAGKSQ
jgi:hypothetical protein